MRKEDFLIVYRVIISLVKMKRILKTFGKQKKLRSFQPIRTRRLFIQKCDRINLIAALSKMTSLYTSNRNKPRKTIAL